MPSFPDAHTAFDNAAEFKKPAAEHPYWVNEIFLMQEYGFSREFLIVLAELDQAQNGRLVSRIRQGIDYIKRMCERRDHDSPYGDRLTADLERPEYEPQYIANALLRRLNDYCGDEKFNGAENLLQYLIETDEIDTWSLSDFEITLILAYHPANRLMRVFEPGVREDGTIVDAAGPASQHPNFVDERGRLFDQSFIVRNSDDLF